MRKRNKILIVFLCVFIAAYVTSYVWLSRRGYAEADQHGFIGFYYFVPEDSDAWRYKNNSCISLYWPLNFVDRFVGIGRYPASEPLWDLSG